MQNVEGIPAEYLKDGEFWGLSWQEQFEAVRKIGTLQARVEQMEQFMVRIAKELGCLPSFSDPLNDNEHIFRALASRSTAVSGKENG